MAMNPRLLRPLASGFNPKSIAGLRLWLDADDSSTITLNGSDVSEWRDKSGNNRHASQETASFQPAFTSNALNGRSALTFGSGGVKLLETTSFASNQPTVLFAVAATNTQGNLIDGIGNRQFIVAGGGAAVGYGSVGTTVVLFTTAWTLAGRIVAVRLDSTSSFIRVDGTQFANADANTGNINSGFRIGAFNSTAASWQGLVAEFLIYGSLTTSEIQAVEKYLSKKWGIAVS
jgi:hypothetical protein